MRKTLTVALALTERTDLMCIACGGFRAELAIKSPEAVFGMKANPVDAHAGIHKKCISAMTRKRTVRAIPGARPVEDLRRDLEV